MSLFFVLFFSFTSTQHKSVLSLSSSSSSLSKKIRIVAFSTCTSSLHVKMLHEHLVQAFRLVVTSILRSSLKRHKQALAPVAHEHVIKLVADFGSILVPFLGCRDIHAQLQLRRSVLQPRLGAFNVHAQLWRRRRRHGHVSMLLPRNGCVAVHVSVTDALRVARRRRLGTLRRPLVLSLHVDAVHRHEIVVHVHIRALCSKRYVERVAGTRVDVRFDVAAGEAVVDARVVCRSCVEIVNEHFCDGRLHSDERRDHEFVHGGTPVNRLRDGHAIRICLWR
mmetsp:Transcript_11950/g.27116  ORF Transcript_11950/g.27116 Transcript_11950/m.27116 type:complete len:279 (-) Transcript_11950:577-1413(-)